MTPATGEESAKVISPFEFHCKEDVIKVITEVKLFYNDSNGPIFQAHCTSIIIT